MLMHIPKRISEKKMTAENCLSAISSEASNLLANLIITGRKSDRDDLHGDGKYTGVTLLLQLQKHRNPENLAEEKPWETLEILIH